MCLSQNKIDFIVEVKCSYFSINDLFLRSTIVTGCTVLHVITSHASLKTWQYITLPMSCETPTNLARIVSLRPTPSITQTQS